MKTRMGFVSNSSSSSFIVISENDNLEWKNKYVGEVLKLGRYGNDGFGWESDKYDDIYSRINFAKIQARYMEGSACTHFKYDQSIDSDSDKALLLDILRDGFSYENILDLVIMRHTGAISIEWDLDQAAYIDHQSAASEGSNLEMFQNEHILRAFLFDEGSHIQGGNDN